MMRIGFVLSMLAGCLVLGTAPVRAAASDFNARDHGARGDGKTLDRAAIQRAIDACASAGGGTVRLPAGVYLTGALKLPSRVVLQLDPGATLLGSPQLKDYYLGNRMVGLILAEDAEGTGIMGSGTIDGSAASFMDMDRKVEADGPVWPRPRPGNMVVFAGCRNFFVRNVTLQNAPFWTLHANGCDNGAIAGITVNNDMRVPNNDGIHLTTSRNIRITGCHIRTGDDAIVATGITDHGPIIPGFVGYRGVCENIVAADCTLASRSCGVRVGYGENDVRNCVFSNLVITDSNRGLGVFVRNKGSVSNILFSNVVIGTRLHSRRWWGNGEPIHVSAAPLPNEAKIGKIQNIRFSNILRAAKAAPSSADRRRVSPRRSSWTMSGWRSRPARWRSGAAGSSTSGPRRWARTAEFSRTGWPVASWIESAASVSPTCRFSGSAPRRPISGPRSAPRSSTISRSMGFGGRRLAGPPEMRQSSCAAERMRSCAIAGPTRERAHWSRTRGSAADCSSIRSRLLHLPRGHHRLERRDIELC